MVPKVCNTLKQYSIRLRNIEISTTVVINELHFFHRELDGIFEADNIEVVNWLIPRADLDTASGVLRVAQKGKPCVG